MKKINPVPALKASCIIIFNLLICVCAVAQQQKEIISDYQEGISVIKKIHPVKYKMKPKKVKKEIYDTDSLGNEKVKYEEETIVNDKIYIGVDAEDLKAIAPDLVSSHPNEEGGETLGIEHSALTYLLINAIKEQQLLIEELQKTLKPKK